MQLSLLTLASVVATSTAGGGLFSTEELPDAPGAGGLFSTEELPDAPGEGGSLFGDPPPDAADDEGGLFDSSAPSLFEPRLRVSGGIEGVAAVDTSFDRRGENVFELSINGDLEIDADFAEDLTLYVAPSFSAVTAINREGDDRELVYLAAPEAHLTWAVGTGHLRFGTQVFNWGTSDFSAPADVLNPTDLRRGFAGATPGQSKIPVLAAEAVQRWGPVTIRGVVQPFFTGSRFFISGWDDSLVRVSEAAGSLQIPDLAGLIEAPTLDRVGDQLLVTDRPADRPDNGTYAARATLQLDDADISVSAVYGFESLPMLTVDPNVATLAGSFLNTLGSGQEIELATLPPGLFDAIDGVNAAIREGRPLFEGTYRRRTLVGADASIAVDPFIIKLDVAYTFARTVYTQDFRGVRRPWLNAVAGFEYVWGENLQILVEAFTLAVFEVRSNERLSLLEPRTPAPSTFDIASERRNVWMPGVIGVVRYSMLDGDLRFEGAVVSTFNRGDIIFFPFLRYRLHDNHEVTLSGLLVQSVTGPAMNGSPDNYSGLYDHNDRVQIGYRWSL